MSNKNKSQIPVLITLQSKNLSLLIDDNLNINNLFDKLFDSKSFYVTK